MWRNKNIWKCAWALRRWSAHEYLLNRHMHFSSSKEQKPALSKPKLNCMGSDDRRDSIWNNDTVSIVGWRTWGPEFWILCSIYLHTVTWGWGEQTPERLCTDIRTWCASFYQQWTLPWSALRPWDEMLNMAKGCLYIWNKAGQNKISRMISRNWALRPKWKGSRLDLNEAQKIKGNKRESQKVVW